VVFDARGARTETGFLLNQRVTERGVMHREGDTMFIDRAALDAAPYLPGCHVVFGNGNLSNYYHWVVDGLLPLFMMQPYLPAGTKLLVSDTIRSLRGQPGTVDHMAALHAWGLGDRGVVEMKPPLCRVEEVIWLDHLESDTVPADLLAAARAHVLARFPPRVGRRRVYIRRRGVRAVLNDDEVEQTLKPLGFETYEMETLTPDAQITLFRDAEDVVATHGVGLTNLMYCAAGTRVLEFMPDLEYRSPYAEISDKLGLVHAVLPCPTDNGQFFGNVSVDVGAMRRLLRQLESQI
jgi:capsular polysaccharide biosynthesis protein